MSNSKPNVLIVEDDQLNQLIACKMLDMQGIQTTVANNGAEAVMQICSKAFQVVLMDIQMPVMDGFEAARRIRAMDDSYFKTVPIIAFSASGLIEIKTKAEKHGMNDCITKPLVIEELQNKVFKYMRDFRRPLYIDFNTYTDGDPDFKKELISLLIGNIRELQQAFVCQSSDALKELFNVIHKVKSTISMLSDNEFSEALEELKTIMAANETGQVFQWKLSHFNQLCSMVIESLSAAA